MTTLAVADHPLLELHALEAVFPRPLGDGWPELALDVVLQRPPPDLPDADTKGAVRALLRHGGFKPAGRSKPASEYVASAIPEGRLGAINAAVDVCNVASLRGGLPISVIDVDRACAPYSVDVCPPGARYVFNAGGQELDLGGLIALHDADGPCANAVKDSQRTKTSDHTVRTLWVIWGTRDLPSRAGALGAWIASALEGAGVRTSPLAIGP